MRYEASLLDNNEKNKVKTLNVKTFCFFKKLFNLKRFVNFNKLYLKRKINFKKLVNEAM